MKVLSKAEMIKRNKARQECLRLESTGLLSFILNAAQKMLNRERNPGDG